MACSSPSQTSTSPRRRALQFHDEKLPSAHVATSTADAEDEGEKEDEDEDDCDGDDNDADSDGDEGDTGDDGTVDDDTDDDEDADADDLDVRFDFDGRDFRFDDEDNDRRNLNSDTRWASSAAGAAATVAMVAAAASNTRRMESTAGLYMKAKRTAARLSRSLCQMYTRAALIAEAATAAVEADADDGGDDDERDDEDDDASDECVDSEAGLLGSRVVRAEGGSLAQEAGVEIHGPFCAASRRCCPYFLARLAFPERAPEDPSDCFGTASIDGSNETLSRDFQRD